MRHENLRRTEKKPSLVRSTALFRGEDATGLDVLYEPLVRARLADATTKIEFGQGATRTTVLKYASAIFENNYWSFLTVMKKITYMIFSAV
jgi:hypothetical protein